MIEIKKKSDCNGCSACVSVCPSNCITMKRDAEGFLYPHIEIQKCIKCNRCSYACPVHKKKEQPITKKTKAYAGYALDNQIRSKSSSGGIFTLLAKNIILKGGAVFGAAFDSNYKVHHIKIVKESEIHLLQGSKYVQSEIGTIYHQVKQCLNDNIPVLFTGTPCQIAGLHSYLQKEYDNLICQDFICHGVPSPMVWERYIETFKKRYQSPIKKVSFRDKRLSWQQFGMMIKYENGKEYKNDLFTDSYLKAFSRNIILRPSCYQCAFKQVHRKSDITLADFWGAKATRPHLYDDKGTSLILVHSEKGEEIIAQIMEQMKWEEIPVSIAIKTNPNVLKSSSFNEKRNDFFANVEQQNIVKLLEGVTKERQHRILLRKLKTVVKKYRKKVRKRSNENWANHKTEK